MRRRDRQPDTAYLKWIRSQACAVARNCRGSIEAHHAGTHGLSQKADDSTAIPLCIRHHRIGFDCFHKLGKSFWTHHKLDRETLIAAYQTAFGEQRFKAEMQTASRVANAKELIQ